MTGSVSQSSLKFYSQYSNPDKIMRTTEAINPRTGKSEPVPSECVVCLGPLHSDATDLQGSGLLKKLVTHKGELGDKHPFHAECLLRSIVAQRRWNQLPSCPVCAEKITMSPSDIKEIEKLDEESFIKEAQGSIKAVKHSLTAAAVTGLATMVLCQTGVLGVFGTALTIGIIAISASSQQRITLMEMQVRIIQVLAAGVLAGSKGVAAGVLAGALGVKAGVVGVEAGAELARVVGVAGAVGGAGAVAAVVGGAGAELAGAGAGLAVALGVALAPAGALGAGLAVALGVGGALAPAVAGVVAGAAGLAGVAARVAVAAEGSEEVYPPQSVRSFQVLVITTTIIHFASIIILSEGGISNAAKLVKRTAIACKRCLWPANAGPPALVEN